MVAWCQESNGSIPQSQLLQVRKMHKWICDTAKSGLAYIMNLCVTLTWLCDCQCSRMSILVHPNGFWTAYSCLVIAERPRYWSMEGIQVWRTHFPDGPLIFFFFFPLLHRISWIPAAVQRSRASFIWKRQAESLGKSSTCSCAVLGCTALLKECLRQVSL